MSKLDQFESQFRAASRTTYEYQSPELQSVMVLSDLEDDAERRFIAECKRLLPDHWSGTIEPVRHAEFSNIGDLLARLQKQQPDLIFTYRHLGTDAWQWPYSLGVNLDVLTQATASPVMVMPHPGRSGDVPGTPNTQVVMAITDHLTGDHHLVNYGAHFTAAGGELHLTHIEPTAHFDRVLEAISKIPGIETEAARTEIQARLLKDPRDYIQGCREVLQARVPDLTVVETVVMGRRLSEYRRLIDEHQVNLLVMNTKDDDQLAMHGMAYPLAVELRDLALLML